MLHRFPHWRMCGKFRGHYEMCMQNQCLVPSRKYKVYVRVCHKRASSCTPTKSMWSHPRAKFRLSNWVPQMENFNVKPLNIRYHSIWRRSEIYESLQCDQPWSYDGRGKFLTFQYFILFFKLSLQLFRYLILANSEKTRFIFVYNILFY